MKKSLVFCTIAALMLTATTHSGTCIASDGTLETLDIVCYKEGEAAALPNPGDYEWWYGCSPTAAGMLMGYYDVQGYNGQSYGNLVPGGDAENHTYGSGSYLANNAIASSGHIDDFYSGGFGASGDDVVPPTHDFDCLADFMGTGQDDCDNSNGSTTFYFFTNGEPLIVSKIYSYGPEYYNSDGMYGIGEYINYAGYDVDVLYNQFIDTLGLDFGFTFEQYMAEIDAGRGVLIHVDNHSMYGYGYDAATSTIFLHDTWSLGEHSMTWGGSYDGLEHYGVTVLTLVPEPATIALLCLGSLSFVNRRRIITKKDNYFKRSGSMKKYFLTTILIMFLSIGCIFTNAKATVTIATFADPSNDSNNPLFTVDFMQMKLNGGWDQTGLILDVPYSGNTFENAWFDMTEVALFPAMGDMYPTSPGTIRFYDDNTSINPLIVIDFDSGFVTAYESFGANEMFIAYNVTITGSEITGALSEEQFSFGFANPAPLPDSSDLNDGFTATASFTSSAIPEPATLCVLCLGTLLINRKNNVQFEK